jgi:hypothetical protein
MAERGQRRLEVQLVKGLNDCSIYQALISSPGLATGRFGLRIHSVLRSGPVTADEVQCRDHTPLALNPGQKQFKDQSLEGWIKSHLLPYRSRNTATVP